MTGSTTFGIYFNSGGINANTYVQGDNVSSIEITNSDQEYYQNGVITLYNVPYSQSIGDTCKVYIDNTLQFNGYVARKQQHIDQGVKYTTYQLIGGTYDLWRYVTDDTAIYTDKKTSYIASSLVAKYCDNISSSLITADYGATVAGELDLTNQVVGDALVTLTEYDEYRFFVDEDKNLRYFNPITNIYSFSVEEEDILDMSPVEEADEDIVNSVLVIGATDYIDTDNVSPNAPSSHSFPSGPIYVAQRFLAKEDTLASIDFYLDRTIDPNQPATLGGSNLFEIWEDTSKYIFDDDFDNYNYLPARDSIDISDSFLTLGYLEEIESQTNDKYYAVAPYLGQTISFSNDVSLYSVWFKLYKAYDHYCALYSCNALGLPTGTAIVSSNYNKTSDNVWEGHTFYFSGQKIDAGVKYALVIYSPDGDVYTRDKDDASVYSQGCLVQSTDGDVWIADPAGRDLTFSVHGRYYSGSGRASSNVYLDKCQYMKATLTDVVSSQFVTISGTNDNGSNWKKLIDGVWTKFDNESEAGSYVRYYMTGNHYFTPKIGECEVEISDGSGGFEDLLADITLDSFSNVSSNNEGLRIYESKIQLSGQNEPLSKYYVADSVTGDAWIPCNGCSDTKDNLIDGTGDHSDLGDYCSQYGFNDLWTWVYRENEFTFNDFISAQTLYLTAGAGGTDFEITYFDVSSNGSGLGWQRVITDWHPINAPGSCVTPYTWTTTHKRVDRVRWKVGVYKYWHNDGMGVKELELSIPNKYMLTGQFSTETYSPSQAYDVATIKVEPSDVSESNYITYSGSADEGANWDKLTPNQWSTISTPGKKVIVKVYMKPRVHNEGTYSYRIDTPKIGGLKIYGSNALGGGTPKSGSKVEWSDDISWTSTNIPYPPSYSGWKTYTSPKLRLTQGDSYWMVFRDGSGQNAAGKYWSYYYDPNSTYENGGIKYSWDRGVNWSGSSGYPAYVPAGDMSFKLGWSEGVISATAQDDESIGLYGIHFRKIEDSNLTTQDSVDARANAAISGSSSIPKKGTLTINGRSIMDTTYRFSANLGNFGINELWDIVSYTQKIDNQGFTTTINYGVQPYDIARNIAKLEERVYGGS